MDLIKDFWALAVALVGGIFWLARLEGRVKTHSERLDRHEARMVALEVSQHQQAVQLARIEEALSGIKLTLDRTYQQVSELGRVTHHTDRTLPPR